MELPRNASGLLSKLFSLWGEKSVGSLGVVSSLLTLILSIVLSVGIRNLEFYESVTEIWSSDNAQSRADKTLYNHAFGGIQREAVVVISSKFDESVLSKSYFQALANASMEITKVSVKKASQADFCSRPDVPALIRKTPPGALKFAIAATFHSYGYAKITRCLARENIFKDSKLQGLEETWGIERFPCSRVSALDCFKEGGYDYPEELQQLDLYSRRVAAAKIQNKEIFNKCSDEVKEEFFNALAAGAFFLPLNEQDEFKEQMKILTENIMLALVDDGGTVDLFATWGYSYRSSYLSMNEDQVSSNLETALKNLQNDSFSTSTCFAGEPCCLTWSGLSLDSQSAFGEVSETKVSAIRTAYFHRSADDEHWAKSIQGVIVDSSTVEGRLEALEQLENSLIDKLLPKFEKKSQSGFSSDEKYNNSDLNFFVSRSNNDILRDAGQTPKGLVAASYTIMIVYVLLVFINYKSTLIHSRILLGLSAILVISISTLVGFGIMGWAGVKVSPLATNVLPFAILGIGVDDIFLILFTLLDNSSISQTPSKRLSVTLAAVGPSVTLTSLSLVIGFLFSALIRIPAVYSFAYQLATTIAVNYVLLMGLFVPICAWDSVRVSQNRIDIVPCLKVENDKLSNEQNVYEGGTLLYRITEITEKRIAPLFFTGKLCAILSTIVAVLFTGAMLAVSLTKSRRGLSLGSIALDGSYQRSFLEIQERAFPLQSSFLVHVAEKDLSSEAAQSVIIENSEDIQKSFGTSDRPAIREISWLYGNAAALLSQYNAPRGFNLSRPIPQSDFYNEFATWTFAGAGSSQLENLRCTNPDDKTKVENAEFISCTTPISINDVLNTNKGSKIALRISRTSFVQRGLIETSDYVKAIRDTKSVLREGTTEGVRSFVYGTVYELWDQYTRSYETIFKVLGLTLLGVAISAFLLLPPKVASIMVLVLIALSVQLVGFTVLIGIDINAISLTNFAIGVSLAIEFGAHYANAFSVNGNEALKKTLPAISAGALSTLLSLLPLVGSKFTLVRLYYYASWTVMTIIAFLNGAIVLPLILHLL